MVNKVFIDINILIDLFDASRQHHESAIILFDNMEEKKCKGYLTESVLNTTSYLIRKDFNSSKLKAMFNHLLSFVDLIPVSNKTYLNGLNFSANDIEDAVLYAAALEAKLNFFITTNTKDFKKIEQSNLPIITSTEFLKRKS